MSFGGSSGTSKIATSTDVALNNTADGQTLIYSASLQKWINGNAAGSGVLETAVALGANATYTGQPHSAVNRVMLLLCSESDQNYTISLQQSNDASTWTTTFTTAPTSNSGSYIASQFLPLHRYNYYRLVVANSATAQGYLTVSSSVMSGS